MLEGLLLGAILSSTDGAAIFAILRGSTLRRRLARTLEGEAGFNDPVAVLLVARLHPLDPGARLRPGRHARRVRRRARHRPGRSASRSAGWRSQGFQRARLATGGLYPVASLATAGLAFGLADTLHGSGFLAVYLAGLALGGAAIPAKRTITTFHDGLGWVAQLTMFLTLGLLVFPSDLPRRRARGRDPRGRGRGRRAADRRRARDRAVRLHLGRAARPRLGGPARRGAGRARDVPGDRGRAGAAPSSSTSSSSR